MRTPEKEGLWMNIGQLAEAAARACGEPGGNFVSAEIAIAPEAEGLRIFDEPILGVAAANDELFRAFMRPEAVGPHFVLPCGWLPNAKSVVSFFFPFTKRVNESNSARAETPSPEWLHARIEGQAFINLLMKRLCGVIAAAGFEAVAPSDDPRFRTSSGAPDVDGRTGYTSNWSERHVAYACGLGTFGLSKGLITKRGVSGRFASLVTSLELPPAQLEYGGLYDWCSMCGACARACPALAISLASGKDHAVCSAFVDETKVKYNPRYGCGKCQSGMPCQSRAMRAPSARLDSPGS